MNAVGIFQYKEIEEKVNWILKLKLCKIYQEILTGLDINLFRLNQNINYDKINYLYTFYE